MNDEHNPEEAPQLPSKGFVALLYLPLMVPALLPLYFASQEEDPALVAIMLGTAVGLLAFNAVMLVLVYRWFAQRGGSN